MSAGKEINGKRDRITWKRPLGPVGLAVLAAAAVVGIPTVAFAGSEAAAPNAAAHNMAGHNMSWTTWPSMRPRSRTSSCRCEESRPASTISMRRWKPGTSSGG